MQRRQYSEFTVTFDAVSMSFVRDHGKLPPVISVKAIKGNDFIAHLWRCPCCDRC